MRLRWSALFLFSVLTAACAAETDRTDGRFEDDEPGERTDDIEAGDAKAPPSDDPDLDAGTKGDAKKPTVDDPGPTSTCSSPRDLGAIAGDATEASVTAQGTCSEWLRIQVNETRTGPFAGAMKLRATLVSPSAADFDLFVFVNKETNVAECSQEAGRSELAGSRSDIVQIEWGEYYTANAADDQRPVSIEVRAKDPASCGKGNWVLLLEGNR